MICTSKNSQTAQNREGGFTLVELSIVLVIIGLIVGGVLVGQDLIRAAETRAIISQIEKYNTAINTFRVKYNGLPGDIANPNNIINGAVVAEPAGDGNGILGIAAGMPEAAPTTITGEVLAFWNHLSAAGFIDGSFSGVGTSGTVLSNTPTTSAPNFPATKANRGGIIAYGMSDGLNYFHIGLAEGTGTGVTTANNLRPEEAFNIDKKVDDGNPNTGSVLARGGAVLESEASAGTGTGAFCMTVAASDAAATSSTYNLLNVAPLCQLRIKLN